jgi:hypothetical protein
VVIEVFVEIEGDFGGVFGEEEAFPEVHIEDLEVLGGVDGEEDEVEVEEEEVEYLTQVLPCQMYAYMLPTSRIF